MSSDTSNAAGEREDAARIAAYLRGDPDAFREVDGWIRADVLSSYNSLRDEHEDVCQRVHEKVLTNLRRERFQRRSTLRSYVAGITHHTAIDRLRQRYRDRILVHGDEREPEDSAQDPYQILAAAEERHLLHRALQLSPESCRRLWGLVFLDRLSYEEVGQRLKVPPGTVKSRSWHCRQKALQILKRLRLRAASGPAAQDRRPGPGTTGPRPRSRDV